jgi:hypothetical protein
LGDGELQRSHFQHSAGLIFKFGGKDTDGDGIFDKDDACPDVAGLKELTVVLILMEETSADKDDAVKLLV